MSLLFASTRQSSTLEGSLGSEEEEKTNTSLCHDTNILLIIAIGLCHREHKQPILQRRVPRGRSPPPWRDLWAISSQKGMGGVFESLAGNSCVLTKGQKGGPGAQRGSRAPERGHSCPGAEMATPEAEVRARQQQDFWAEAGTRGEPMPGTTHTPGGYKSRQTA